jgi:hypothetical protein
MPELVPPAQVSEPTPPPPEPQAEQSIPIEANNQPIINWVKFWDTMAVVVAYPWLCCGVALLLLVPVILLFLEIQGRRRPPMPPEPLPEDRRRNEE